MTIDTLLEIEQVWETTLGTVEIVALGPEYVAYKYRQPPFSFGSCTKVKFRSLAFKLVSPPKPKHTVWVNVYDSDGDCFGYAHPTRAVAEMHSDDFRGRIACIKVEFQEGDGLT